MTSMYTKQITQPRAALTDIRESIMPCISADTLCIHNHPTPTIIL